jgi:twitching motility protein PilT
VDFAYSIPGLGRFRCNIFHQRGTSQYGMQTFEQAIYLLYKANRITLEEALRCVSNVDEFKLKVQGIATTSDMTRNDMAETLDVAAPSSAATPAPSSGPDVTRFGG